MILDIHGSDRDGFFIQKKYLFLGKGEIFRVLCQVDLSKLHIIPVYRKQDSSDDPAKMQTRFQNAMDHSRKNGTLLIFPEGVSIPSER